VPSAVVLITSAVSAVGFAINVLVMAILLWRGRKRYHLLFAALLLIGSCWDLGILLIMIRNSFPEEIVQYQNLITIPMGFLPALMYHFATNYLEQPQRKMTIALYVYCIWGFIMVVTGLFKPVSGVYNYSWGSVARYEPNLGNLSWVLITYTTILVSCRLLLQAHRREDSPLVRRHIGYILASFIVFTIAHLKILLVYGVDLDFLLPLGMLLIDSFGALIGIAIVKDRLFDITVFVRKGIVYSIMVAAVIFVFDFSQHLIAEFLGGIAGEQSTYVRYASIAMVVIVFMPLKPRLERAIDGIFATKKIEF